MVNAEFTQDEIMTCISKLKNNKAAGSDQVLNEYIKNSAELMLPVYENLFNLILQTGEFPSAWTSGVIIPLYKKKGSEKDPDSHRGISLLSCLGKAFTSVLSRRLSLYLEDHDLLGEEQAGFRSGYSTMDHVFTLKCIVDICLSQGKIVCSIY